MSNSTTSELVANIKANTVKKKEAGIGYMWANTTGALGRSFAVVGNIATAAEVLSKQAVRQTVQGNIESAEELCLSMGVEAKGFEALEVADAITAYVISK